MMKSLHAATLALVLLAPAAALAQTATPTVNTLTAAVTGATVPTPLTGTGIQNVGGSAAASRIETDSFAGTPVYTCRRADGTSASPSAVQSGDIICDFNAWAFGASTYVGPGAAIHYVASEAWSSGHQGTYMDIQTTPTSSTTLTEAMRVNASGGVSVGGTPADPGAGGFTAQAGYYLNGNLMASATAPTVASGFCTTTTTVSASNGAFAFALTLGASGCSGNTGVLTMPTAPHGWVCSAHDITTPASNVVEESATGTTSVTLTKYVRTTGVAGTFTASDVLVVNCSPY